MNKMLNKKQNRLMQIAGNILVIYCIVIYCLFLSAFATNELFAQVVAVFQFILIVILSLIYYSYNNKIEVKYAFKVLLFAVVVLGIYLFKKLTIGSLLTALALFFTIDLLKGVYISKYMRMAMFILCNIVLFIFLISIKTPAQSNVNLMVFKFLFINFTLNLNSASYLVLLCYLFSFLHLFNNKNFCIYFLIYTAAIVFLLYLLKSRAVMVALAGFLVAAFFFGKKMTLRKSYKLFTLVTLGSFLFVIFYVVLASIPSLENFTVLGKPIFTGRQEIWLKSLKQINIESFLFGRGSDIYEVHNSLCSMFLSFGIATLLIYLSQCFGWLNSLFRSSKVSYQMNIAILAQFSIFIVAFFETNLTYAPFVIISLLFIPLSESYRRDSTIKGC